MLAIRFLLVGIIILSITGQAFAVDTIPEKLSGWTEKGIVLQNSSNIAWENKPGIAVSGIAKVGGIYYLHYLAGFDGCWNNDGDVNHQALGLATSTDGVNFTKFSGNPVLKPHNFVPVHAHEEGIRTAYIKYLPSKGKFYGYFGVESPGGSQTCDFGANGPSYSCGCDTGVDAQVFLGTSVDGKNWTVEGAVGGTYATNTHEVYAADWVYNGSQFGLYVTVAEGAMGKFASRGSNPLSLSELGGVSALAWGWSGLDAYLHDDNNTVTLIYNPYGGNHPGVNNDNLYFATTSLNDMKNIQNERVITTSGELQNKIFRDGNEWKWYYSDDPSWNINVIKLRTHPLINNVDTVPPNPPQNLKATEQ
ncbi:hypothetical protein [Candidatus Nitrospira neomarina]|uniref:Glycosyl hydrolase family 32 N-terminal domain-containing protein n=1 Tax=Candidatus Nitrospira neomarina TaxID=3020899 RepID=A0AA96GUU2_9BACT|nr:hypothetical protein [Candidatus Nitrospira neomarina]WNM64001.1 hypothetical protein PQG83_09665 [Candidatus Nitrospira neomarina]